MEGAIAELEEFAEGTGGVWGVLEKEKSIERYAYFEPGKGKEHSLLTADGSLTRMGELYRDAGV